MRVEAEVSTVRNVGWTLGATGISFALLVWAASNERGPGLYVVIAGLVAVLSFVALVRGIGHQRRRKRRVGADARGLSLDGALVVPRKRLASARVSEHADGTASVIVRPRGLRTALLVHLPTDRLAQALVDELERAPAEASEFEVLPPWAHRMRWVAVLLTTSPWIVVNLLRFLPAFTIAIVAAGYALVGLPILLPQRLVIGEDGVLLRWAGRTRFVPFHRILAAHGTPLGVELELAEGETLEVRVGHRADASAQRRDAMLARIEGALRAQRALAPADDEAVLARGARPLAAWIAAAEALGRDDVGGYRVAAIPRERLWAVLENAAAEPSAREAAAIALRAALADDERERLARVAQKSASPRLRITLDAVGSGADPAALELALEDEPEETRSGRV